MRLVMRTLNDYLREKRLDSGLSQLDVARVLGYASPQFVSNWERGLVSPPLETIAVLIEIYKIPSNDVINRILAETRGYLEESLSTKANSKGKKTAVRGAIRSKTGGARKKSGARRESAHA
jgi:transcriptional regulator with XRE-family HTH domain